jgi:hypothetical protein
MVANRNKHILPDIEDIIWFAGFFDGEGCITIRHNKRNRGNGHSYNLLLQISGTHYPTVDKLVQIWRLGKALYIKPKTTTRKPSWGWRVRNRDALFILETIYPYLVTKRNDGLIGIMFQKWKSQEADVYGKRRPEISYIKEKRIQELLTLSHYTDVGNVEQSVKNILGSHLTYIN